MGEFVDNLALLQLRLEPKDWYKVQWRIVGIEKRLKQLEVRFEVVTYNLRETKKLLEGAFAATALHFDENNGRRAHSEIVRKARQYLRSSLKPIVPMSNVERAKEVPPPTGLAALPQNESKQFLSMLERVTGLSAPPPPSRPHIAPPPPRELSAPT